MKRQTNSSRSARGGVLAVVSLLLMLATVLVSAPAQATNGSSHGHGHSGYGYGGHSYGWGGHGSGHRVLVCVERPNGKLVARYVGTWRALWHLANGDPQPQLFYRDRDQDGFTPANARARLRCSPNNRWIAQSPEADCNDYDAAVSPGAVEIIGNGIDDDCDPTTPDTSTGPPASQISCDGQFTLGDPLLVNFYNRGTLTAGTCPVGPGELSLVDADFNSDGTVNGVDVSLMLNCFLIVGIANCPPSVAPSPVVEEATLATFTQQTSAAPTVAFTGPVAAVQYALTYDDTIVMAAGGTIPTDGGVNTGTAGEVIIVVTNATGSSIPNLGIGNFTTLSGNPEDFDIGIDVLAATDANGNPLSWTISNGVVNFF